MVFQSNEILMDILYGGIFGACAGYLTKQIGHKAVGGVLAGSFFLYRAAVFDGDLRATWSPLNKDDPSVQSFIKRKARREAFSVSKRLQTLIEENAIIAGSYTGACVLTHMSFN